jgi:hypothetical protein
MSEGTSQPSGPDGWRTGALTASIPDQHQRLQSEAKPAFKRVEEIFAKYPIASG